MLFSLPTLSPFLMTVTTEALFCFSSWMLQRMCEDMCKKSVYATFYYVSRLPGVVKGATLSLYCSTFLNTSIKYLFKTTTLKKQKKIMTFGTY